ncbi:DUF3311 domain-containing protein [Nakamurella endophytica]|uniref:DUF3311 domain-containing protein n=1 Tax=Nakamurella endophytica TaxID=1748367 RepID=A0A917SMX0_9ACTN|nr:DUF3311 domain-containing protein [Nakamurella endophytica]GGL87664.1 hypothetical protein GCM10011594_04130 [Nakamurella endophytica]
MPGSTPVGDEGGTGARGGLRFSVWNLLLLLPLLMLITPWFNKDRPRLFGLPFFYWYQFAFVFVGVACVAIVFAATRSLDRGEAGRLPAPANPDEGDLGTSR